MILGPKDWKTPAAGMQREWLMTNGLGGYASTSVTGANNRRYHGLLVAGLGPARERQFILSQISEAVVTDDACLTLLSYHSKDQAHRGEENLRQFEWAGMPIWRYQAGTLSLEKQVVLVHGRNLAVVRYILRNGGTPATIHLTPLVNFRNHHYLSDSQYAQFEVDFNGREMTVHPFGSQAIIRIACSEGLTLVSDRAWFNRMDYPQDRMQGFPAVEDHFIPGHFEIPVGAFEQRTITLSASFNEHLGGIDGDACIRNELARQAALPLNSVGEDPFVRSLSLAADQFVIRNQDAGSVSIVAGYPWIGAWGRDSVIAFPGLLLKTKRFEEAASLLASIGSGIRGGLMANSLLPEKRIPKDFSADGPLWFFDSLYRYYLETENLDLVRELMPVLEDTFLSHVSMKIQGMAVDSDGLLVISDGSAPLTWMNARIGHWVVTPRTGKVVEINALWYNALRVLAFFRECLGKAADLKESTLKHDAVEYADMHDAAEYADMHDAAEYADMPDPAELADSVKTHFTDVFWNPENGCLDDVAECSPPDNRIRPNQILSMSLSFPVFSGELARKALDTVYGKLHVPLGFRSLDAGHEQFRARYEGDQYAREGAMHQGTAWPWFIGPFVTAWKRNHADDPDLERFLKDVFLPFEDHLLDGGLGCISQLVDGTHPHEPRGCISQAWCVAEVLRAYLEDYASIARRTDKGGG